MIFYLKKASCVKSWRAIWLMAAIGYSSAGNAQTPIQIGVFVPEVIVNPIQQYNYIEKIATDLKNSLNIPFRGSIYKHHHDFLRAQKQRALQFAILGAFAFASYNTGRVLAAAVPSSSMGARWTLMAREKQSLAVLKGKQLVVPNVGRLVIDIIQNGLLQGNLSLRKHFKIERSPNVLSATLTVLLGQGDIVFSPVGTKKLTPLLKRNISIPGPVLVLLDDRVPAQTITKITQSLLSYQHDGIFGRWQHATRGPYVRLAALARRPQHRMMLIPMKPGRLNTKHFINESVVNWEMPALDELITIP